MPGSIEPNINGAAAIAEPAENKKNGSFTSLRNYNFRILFSGYVLGTAAMWIQNVALNWMVYDATGSGTVLGTINLANSMAGVVMCLFASYIADLYNRRKTLIAVTMILFCVALALGLVLITGRNSLTFIFLYVIICGFVQTMDGTIRQVLLFDAVPRPEIPGAQALAQTGASLMRIIGPALGGFLLLTVHAGPVFLIIAGLFLCILSTVFLLKLPERAPVRSSPFRNIVSGISEVAARPYTRIFTIVSLIMPITIVPIFIILPPIFAVKIFHDTTGTIYSYLLASAGVGGILGGLVLTVLRRYEHWGRLQMAAIFMLSVTFVSFSFNSNVYLAYGLMALAGFFEIFFLSANITSIQLSIPDNVRAKVTAAITLSIIFNPVGSMIAGAGADLLGSKRNYMGPLRHWIPDCNRFLCLFA